uniref:Uncharacterized protein n=1 Tax=Chenopodium quinoa TaxID=63459 RepID=A0A803M540_CHEQI
MDGRSLLVIMELKSMTLWCFIMLEIRRLKSLYSIGKMVAKGRALTLRKPIVIDEESHDSEYDSAYNAETSEDDEDDQNNSEYQPVWRRRTRARSDYSTTGKTPQLGACFISNRRDPTDKEKERAVEKATEFMEAIQRQNKIQNAPMFQITLKPTHVKHKFLLVCFPFNTPEFV